MKITPDLFQACLKCPTKCWLRFTCEPPTGNPYAEWVQTENESYRTDSAKRLVANAPADECAPPLGSSRREEAHYSAENLKTAKWRFALDLPVRIELRSSRGNEAQASSPEISQSLLTSAATIETRLHAVERIPSAGRGKPAQFVPIRFVFRNKLTKYDRLLLAFDALVLSQVLGREIGLGKIIHGDDHATLKIRTSALAGEVRKRLEKIAVLLSSSAPPDLVLNRHCAECEFQVRCRKIAVEKDDLSLLAGMSAKERERHRSKGIFTVNQLSYTFRPRRTPKRTKYPAKPHYFALQALAIRENTVYIHGTPGFPECKSQVYLDIEGLPDRDSYYLIGALVVADGQETFHSFWADTLAEQTTIFSQLAESISGLPDFRVFHFGEYDTMALKKMAAFLPEVTRCGLEAILQRSVNVLSLVHPHVYFPTYSSSLKEIGKRLGCANLKLETTGLQSIIWRTEWEAERNAEWKAKLVEYNRTDCLTLRKLTEFLLSNMASTNSSEENEAKVKHTDEIQKARPRWRMFARKDYALDDLRHINKCGYFDYQREKVFVKTHKYFRKISDSRHKGKCHNLRPNKIVDLVLKKCPACMAKNLQPISSPHRYSLNLKFTRSGVKRAVTRIQCWNYRCVRCGGTSTARPNFSMKQIFEHGLMSWCVYFMVRFFYRPSREASFLTEMFGAFSGILVSDFFTGYDSMPCPQQKCLVHLVRELDEDLIHNPFNEQFKILAQGFGSLLRPIIETVDCYGLKRRHLAKHKREVDRFLKAVAVLKPDSDLVEKYRNRFLKYWPKMFTFLDFDGVPWNNNNAEHAIKRFAKYRRNTDGCYTERSLKEYLVLASVLETCEFNNVNVLRFLLSKETTLDGLLRMAGRRIELPATLPTKDVGQPSAST